MGYIAGVDCTGRSGMMARGGVEICESVVER